MLEFLMIFLLLSLSFIAWIIYLFKTMWTYHLLPCLTKEYTVSTQESLPFISVIVPTRNEAYRIQPCIRTLKAQTYPHLEIIIIDDSTDNTIEVIKTIIRNDPRFTIVKQDKLAKGWIGKPHALQQGSRLVKGEWLLFIDADTSHHPELITKAVEYARTNSLDFLSLIPHHLCQSFWEKVIQPIPLGLLPAISPLGKVNKTDSKAAIAFGPFILIKHAVFTSVGGYETIKGRIADDAEIAKLVKNAGFKLGLANAQDLIKIRMYEKLSEIWEGWSKNIFLGLVQKRDIDSKAYRILVALLGAVCIFGLMVLPFFATIMTFVLAILTHVLLWQQIFLFALFTWIVSCCVQFCIQKYYKIGDPKYAVLAFLGGLVTIGIFLNSAIKSLLGTGVTWKGRIYTG